MGLLLVALVAAGCSRDQDIAPPPATPVDTGSRAGAAQETTAKLASALRDRNVSAGESLAVSDARPLVAAAVDNARSLDLRELSMRYVDEGAPLTAAERARYGQRAWVGSVELTYAFGGIDTMPAHVETAVVFTSEGSRARIVAFGSDGVRTPLWLTARLSVVRGPRTLVAVAGTGTSTGAGRYPRLVTRAVAQVRRTLPDWSGPLVFEVPADRAGLDSALDADPGEYDAIAAVTTTEDGSLATGAPVRVFINPEVFGKLAEKGAQVVSSHEATHVATDATFTDMPTWLLEGFADYVALNRAGVPVSLAAGQILPRIRKEGLPDRLPTSADLDPTANGLGATYEEAWLACRFLAQEFGQRRLIAFYRSVSDGTPERRAFRHVLGTSQKQFVARWRDDLARLAGVGPNA